MSMVVKSIEITNRVYVTYTSAVNGKTETIHEDNEESIKEMASRLNECGEHAGVFARTLNCSHLCRLYSDQAREIGRSYLNKLNDQRIPVDAKLIVAIEQYKTQRIHI